METGCEVSARFFAPPEALRRYFTTFYLIECTAPDGVRLTDHLHPEWANLRIFSGDCPDAEGLGGDRLSGSPFCATGPSSKAVRFTVGATRMWGIGLLPLGWMGYVGTAADELADAVVDGARHPAFSSFAALAGRLFGPEPDPDGELERIAGHFLARPVPPMPDEDRIVAIHMALVDPDVLTVSDLVARVGIGQRTIERICHRAFGFSPKVLLRRQRFMRSLAQYLLDPSLKWIGALDGHYHDQAQFVRDFHQFMGMSPSAYAALDKPILSAVIKARARFVGRPVQALDTPDGGAAR
ncbi:AraC family transcriptional regulator [Novosphingobium flavum]|uniref:AraC family transcriptional regulator n=1 Tax=Novosphingobium flavum TaxID=1778672 RepID=A0A7X1KNJ3_9SPHN|nr:AraC family transcriptional regulator [Novosphingobium flavum]